MIYKVSIGILLAFPSIHYTGFLFIAKDALMEKISQYRSFVILPTVSADNGPRLLISAVLP